MANWGFWRSKENVIAEARKYKRRSDFIRGSNGAYSAAIRYGWDEEAMSHMPTARRWTKESARAEAKKFSSRGAFHDEAQGCWGFAKAQGQEFLDEICSHMEILWEERWTFEACRAEAAKHQHRKDFDNACTSAYQRARQNGWLDEICAHMDRKGAPWTIKQNVLDVAKTFQTRKVFAREAGAAYRQAISNGWLEEACAHMHYVDHGFQYCVYVIFNRRLAKAYVGVTKNFEQRSVQHKYGVNTTASKEITQEVDTIFEQITPYLFSSDDVKSGIEKSFIEITSRKGFNILNHNKSLGMLGQANNKWSKELLLQIARKYKTRKEFREHQNGAYQAALRLGILDDIAPPKSRISWTLELALSMAKDYKSISDIAQNNKTLFNALHRHKWMPKVAKFLPKFHKKPVETDPATGRFVRKNATTV